MVRFAGCQPLTPGDGVVCQEGNVTAADRRHLRPPTEAGARPAWEFERDGEVVQVDPDGPLIVRVGAATDLAVDAAVAGTGVIHLFEDWLRPALDSGALEPVLQAWWQPFSGPFLYYPSRRYLPAPLRAFVDFIGSSANGRLPPPTGDIG